MPTKSFLCRRFLINTALPLGVVAATVGFFLSAAIYDFDPGAVLAALVVGPGLLALLAALPVWALAWIASALRS
jgi:hypothetical protein